MSQSSTDTALTAKLRKEIECDPDEDFGTSSPSIQQLEYKIQTRRILQIFDNAIKSVQLTFCLEQMVNSDYIMNETFDYQTKQQIQMFCQAVNEGLYGDVLHQGMSKDSIHLSSMFEKIMKSNLKTEISHFIGNVSTDHQESTY